MTSPKRIAITAAILLILGLISFIIVLISEVSDAVVFGLEAELAFLRSVLLGTVLE